MVPRDRVTMVALDASWTHVLQTVLASPFSRLPVYRESPERIVGMLRVKDLVERHAGGGPFSVASLMRPVLVIDGGMPADRVLTTLRDRRAHSAVVIDDQGHALGLVAIQDVLAELLGAAGVDVPRPLPRTEVSR
jgi:CBS domain containing-hemolysin-like protein